MSEPALHLIQRLPEGLAAARPFMAAGDRIVLLGAARGSASTSLPELLELQRGGLHVSVLESGPEDVQGDADSVDATTVIEWIETHARVHSWW